MLAILVMTLVAIGTVAFLIFYFLKAHGNLASKISGIWANSDHTVRIMIYDIDSVFQAEIIWAARGWEELLGKQIFKNFKFRHFSRGEGTYLCPFTKKQYTIKLKSASETLKFYLQDSDLNTPLTQEWLPVRQR